MVSCEQKPKETEQYMVQQSIYVPATAANDDKILRLCEKYDFLAVEIRFHKEWYVQYMKKTEQNEGQEFLYKNCGRRNCNMFNEIY